MHIWRKMLGLVRFAATPRTLGLHTGQTAPAVWRVGPLHTHSSATAQLEEGKLSILCLALPPLLNCTAAVQKSTATNEFPLLNNSYWGAQSLLQTQTKCCQKFPSIAKPICSQSPPHLSKHSLVSVQLQRNPRLY